VASSLAGRDWVPCCALNALEPSVPQMLKMCSGPPGCWLIHDVRLYTLPLIALQQLEALPWVATCASVNDVDAGVDEAEEDVAVVSA